jgi:hypothetical protein
MLVTQKSPVLFDPIISGAKFSSCRKYRFVLYRIWNKALPMIMFIGLNPSKAGETNDDPTIRRVKSMAAAWGFGGVYMLNCFPYISTNPDDLNDFGNTEENDLWLQNIAGKCTEIIFAWGNFSIVKEKGRDKELQSMFPNAKALIINKDGSPRHPLYVPASVTPVNWHNGKE